MQNNTDVFSVTAIDGREIKSIIISGSNLQMQLDLYNTRLLHNRGIIEMDAITFNIS